MFLFISDTHIGVKRYGIREYTDRILDVFDEQMSIINKFNIKTVIHAGDLFESLNISNKTLLSMVRILKKYLKDDVVMHILVGNHDIKASKDKNESYIYLIKEMFPNNIIVHDLDELYNSLSLLSDCLFWLDAYLSENNIDVNNLIKSSDSKHVNVIKEKCRATLHKVLTFIDNKYMFFFIPYIYQTDLLKFKNIKLINETNTSSVTDLINTYINSTMLIYNLLSKIDNDNEYNENVLRFLVYHQDTTHMVPKLHSDRSDVININKIFTNTGKHIDMYLMGHYHNTFVDSSKRVICCGSAAPLSFDQSYVKKGCYIIDYNQDDPDIVMKTPHKDLNIKFIESNFPFNFKVINIYSITDRIIDVFNKADDKNIKNITNKVNNIIICDEVTLKKLKVTNYRKLSDNKFLVMLDIKDMILNIDVCLTDIYKIADNDVVKFVFYLSNDDLLDMSTQEDIAVIRKKIKSAAKKVLFDIRLAEIADKMDSLSDKLRGLDEFLVNIKDNIHNNRRFDETIFFDICKRLGLDDNVAKQLWITIDNIRNEDMPKSKQAIERIVLPMIKKVFNIQK